MKTHAIIPVFIPHEGCPHDCVFCDQRSITARDVAPDEAQTRSLIESHLSTIEKNPGITEREIAFFGGSFTGIPAGKQEMYLGIAQEYKEAGRVGRIRLSTRPDYISEAVLKRMKKYGVDMIELGVQSFDDEVLKLSRRGHDSETVFRSARLIKEAGIDLGIQLMTGLPADSREKCIVSARRAVQTGPCAVRIYPTVVLRRTELYQMYLRGEYRPPGEEESVETVKEMLKIFAGAGIDVIRVGLKSSDNIDIGSDAVGAGTYHPAFRQLAEGALAREELERQLLQLLPSGAVLSSGIVSGADGEYKTREAGGKTEKMTDKTAGRRGKGRPKVTFFSSPGSFSAMVGLKRANKIYFADKYPMLNIRFAVDSGLKRGEYRVSAEPHT